MNWLVRDVVDALHHHRRAGSTTVCANAAKASGAILVVQHEQEKQRVQCEFGRDVFAVTVRELPRKLRGRRDPLIFDPHTVAAMYSTEVDAAHQSTRRRLLVKLLKERDDARWRDAREYENDEDWDRMHRNDRWSDFFGSLASALESNQPLTYFQRLGEDK